MTSLALCLPVAQRLKSLDTPENNFNEVVYYLGDFPWILARYVAEIRPDWKPEEPPPIPPTK
jgi:hypothetical protein